MLVFLASVAWAGALPDIDEPLKTGAKAPLDAAVVVGIEDYFVLPDVPYATRDASAFYRYLVYTRGVPASRVKLLDRGASREAILAAAAEVGRLGGGEGLVWVYFAGHGAASPTTGERLLLGDDARADLATFEARAVSVAELRDRAAAGGADVMMVLDTCYTGAGRDGAELIGGKRFAVPSYAVPSSRAVAEWTAASPGQWSGPLEPVQHGAFTYLAIGALRGWADGQVSGRPDGKVTAEEAQLYVQEALRALQVDDQTPVLSAQAGESWVLSSGAREAAPVLDASWSRVAAAPAVPDVIAPSGASHGSGRKADGASVPNPDPALGPSGAPVTIVQYSAYGCAHCGLADPVVRRVVDAYDGQVRLVFKDFPLSNLPRSIPAAVAAHCAGEQARYWEMADALFRDSLGHGDADLLRHASGLGLDTRAFEACTRSGRYEAAIQQDKAEGTSAGVTGVPAFFVNGVPLAGSQPYEVFQALVERELAR